MTELSNGIKRERWRLMMSKLCKKYGITKEELLRLIKERKNGGK